MTLYQGRHCEEKGICFNAQKEGPDSLYKVEALTKCIQVKPPPNWIKSRA